MTTKEAVASLFKILTTEHSHIFEYMRDMLNDWRRKLNEVAQSRDSNEIKKVREAWVKWLAEQQKYGYIQIESGV